MSINGYQVDGNPVSATTSYQYNGPFNQISQIDGPIAGNSDTTVYSYYSSGRIIPKNNRNRLKSLTNPVGIILRDNIQYTDTGKVSSEQKPNGLTASYSYYAGNDRLETVSNSDGTKTITTHMDYLASGEIKEITRNYGTTDASILTLNYDQARRLTRVTDAQGNYVEYILDTEGNQEFENTYDPTGILKKTIAQVFDDYDQIQNNTQSGVINTMNYGSDGNLYDQTNGNNVTTDYDYDALNRLTQITQDFNGSSTTAKTMTQFEYDANDRVSKVTDANNHATLYEYDDLGRLTRLTSPDTGTDVFTYDGAGNVLSKLNATGDLTSFTYDAASRPLSVDYPGTDLDVRFAYDDISVTLIGFGFTGLPIYLTSNGLNQLTSFYDSNSSTTLLYDLFGNLTYKKQIVIDATTNNNTTSAIRYQYDQSNRLQSITYPSGLKVNNQYNNLNQVININTSINGQNIDIVNNISYLPMGPLKSMVLGNDLQYDSNFDNGYRLNSYNYGNSLSGQYYYDQNHNIEGLTRESNKENQRFGYDKLDRITQDSAAELVYTYDKLGNRTSSQFGRSPPIDYTYDSQSNILLKLGKTKARNYDKKGNTLTIPSENKDFKYNDANRMSYFIQGKGNRAEYTYNGIGQRIYKKTLGKKPAQYVYLYNANGQMVTETKLNSANQKIESRQTIWLGNRPIAQVRTAYDTNGNLISTNVYYILTDHLKTPRKVTDNNGNILWSWNSDAFGTTLANEDVDGNGKDFVFNLRFPGQYFDIESGQHYNYFRDYEPGTGRYLESDPIGLRGGVNTFGYVGGNPLIYSDSTGLKVWFCQRQLGEKPSSNRGGSLLNHQYTCATTRDGNIECGSTTTDVENPADFLINKSRPTRPNEDYFLNEACDEVDDDENRCMEKCVLKKLRKKTRPPYGIGWLGRDCQEYTDNLIVSCRTLCKLKNH